MEEDKKKGKELSIALPSPKPPRFPRKSAMKTWGKGDLATILKRDLFAIGNRNKQTTETNDKELFHECNIKRGKKFLLARQPVFLFVNYFSCSYLTKLPLQFNNLSSKTNKPPRLQKSPVLGKVLHLQAGAPLWGCSEFQAHTAPTLPEILSVLAFLSQLSKKSRTNTKPSTAACRPLQLSELLCTLPPAQKQSLQQFPNSQSVCL